MKLVIHRADGGVTIYAAPEDPAYVETLVEKWKSAADPSWLPIIGTEIVEDDAVPADRTYRNAWVMNGKSVDVDMPKARELHKEHLRQKRAPEMAAADIEFMRELETLIDKLPLSAADKAPITAVIARKQELRDVTADPAIGKAKTPAALKAAIPKALKNG